MGMTKTSIKTAVKTRVKKPRMFKVVVINDDFTTFEFVVEVLRQFFHKSKEEATQLTITIHNEGRAVAGIYSRDLAETKAQQVRTHARQHGHPLMCETEQV